MAPILDHVAASSRAKGSDIQMGFTFFTGYEVDVSMGVDLFTVDVEVNMGVTIKKRAADGLLNVRLLNPAVKTVPGGVTNPIGRDLEFKPMIESSIEAQFEAIKDQFNDALTNPVNQSFPFEPEDTACAGSDDLEERQQECLSIVEDLLAERGIPSDALERRNFDCASGQCTFHPIVQEVHMLPTKLEIVLAPDFSRDLSEPDSLTPFYTLLMPFLQPLLDQVDLPGDPEITASCEDVPSEILESGDFAGPNAVTTRHTDGTGVAHGLPCVQIFEDLQ